MFHRQRVAPKGLSVAGVRFWLMGNKPQIIVAPSALADLAHKSASYKLLFNNLEADKLVAMLEKRLEPIIKAAKLMQENIAKAFDKAKDYFKRKLVKYLPFDLPLFEIPRAQIQPSISKGLQLPNSYRSHSPPICSVIKWSWFKTI